MKILICTGIFPPEFGGPATYSKNLAEALTKQGHEVRVITYSDGIREDGLPYPVTRVTRRKFKPWHYYKYFQAVKKFAPSFDAVYAQDPVSAGYPVFLACKIIKKQYVVKVTGDYSWEQAMGRGLTDKMIDDFQKLTAFPKTVRKMRDVQIRVSKEAAYVVTPSEYLKSIVAGWGVKPHRIKVIYNSVRPVAMFGRDQARAELGVSAHDFLVLSVGRRVKWKGFETLERTVNELRKSFPDISLKILNEADRQTTDKYFCAADIFVLNTGYEGFSHTVLEALTAELPVVTTKVGGNIEIIKDGENGFLVGYDNEAQLRQAILDLYQHADKREKFSSAALGLVSQFSFDNMINQTVVLLKSCAF